MVKKILLSLVLLMVCLALYSQTYTITEEELRTLETAIVTQQTQLTALKSDLTEALTELRKAGESLQARRKSFDEYESAALRIQESLQTELFAKTRQLKDWQIAVPITGAACLIGGLLIGIFASN